MATLEEALKSPEEVKLLIEDFDAFRARHRLDQESAARAANFSGLASQVLRQTPMTLTDLTNRISTTDLGGFGSQDAATYTNSYTNQFQDQFTDSGVPELLEQLGLKVGDFNVGRTIGGRGRGL